MSTHTKRVAFQRDQEDFLSTLRERVHLYFKKAKHSPKATTVMYFKSLCLVSLAACTYAFMLSGMCTGLAFIGLYFLLGIFLPIAIMNISHDALHGAYFTNAAANRGLGFIMDLLGTSSFYWRKEHVVDHHTFTNIAEHDADLDVPIILRLSPRAPYRRYHRFQQWYAPILYSLNLTRWIYFSDFKRLYNALVGRETLPPKREIFLLLFFKCLHVFLFIALPMMVLPISFIQILVGYLGCLSIAGVIITTIFQLAHIVEDVSFPLPNEYGKMANSFIKHQLATTSNFATDSPLVSLLFGGLNFQIEHHLFPHISHIHLRKIAPLVAATAREFGLPYHYNHSLMAALRSHYSILKRLGRAPLTQKEACKPQEANHDQVYSDNVV